MTLEQNLAALDRLADKIEDKDVTLETSLEIFAESLKIADECMKQLSDCKGRLTVLQEKMSKLSDENNR